MTAALIRDTPPNFAGSLADLYMHTAYCPVVKSPGSYQLNDLRVTI